ncbi:MAG TPA: hypothetical protein DCY27_14125 [Desulfobacterales bacterium]|nr:hypothetical protein [Desulfobacterales bacterium]
MPYMNRFYYMLNQFLILKIKIQSLIYYHAQFLGIKNYIIILLEQFVDLQKFVEVLNLKENIYCPKLHNERKIPAPNSRRN